MREPWFIASIEFIKGLIDQDMNIFQDYGVGVKKANVVDGQHILGDHTKDGHFVEGVNETIIENIDRLLLEEGDGVLDSEGGCQIPESDNVKQSANVSIAKLFSEVRGSSNNPMVDDFTNDYMDVLNDEEIVPNYSLDDMDLQHKEENLIVKQAPVEHQLVDESIDVQRDKTTVLQKNVKHQSNNSQYVNVVKDDYKPCLASVFAFVKAKKKKCGIRKNYVLRFVKERKKRLDMALDSPFSQQSTNTPASPKTRSRSVKGDVIMPPAFEEEISRQPRMRSINELMTLEAFVENLSRPHDCQRDKVTVPDDMSNFIKMKDLPEYRFPWGYRDIVVGRIF
ncbi:hypothetical protein Tco_0699782 [Tanacetum coccineum]